MEIFLVDRLKDWMATLDGTEKVNFNSFGINTLFSLSHTLLCFPFLHAAARCWDPFTHVFCFGMQEMCPTLEEFQALMESRRNEEIMPQPLFGHTRALEQMCGLSFNEAKSLAHDGELDIPSLIRRFSGIRNRRDLLWQGYRQHALYLCLLAHYLLAPSVSGVSIRLIEVARRLKEGRSCIGLALAETLVGLDAFHRRETSWFAGSPLLLQVWLMDKLKVVDPCSECSVRSYFFCSQLVSFPTEGLFSLVSLVHNGSSTYLLDS